MTTPPIDYSRKWYVMTALGIGSLLETIDSSSVNMAAHALRSSPEAGKKVIAASKLSPPPPIQMTAAQTLAAGAACDMSQTQLKTFGQKIFTMTKFNPCAGETKTRQLRRKASNTVPRESD